MKSESDLVEVNPLIRLTAELRTSTLCDPEKESAGDMPAVAFLPLCSCSCGFRD
jgi:hypothetical protein